MRWPDVPVAPLFQLGAGAGAGDHGVGLAADAGARVAPQTPDALLSLGAGHRLQRPGEHPGLTGPRPLHHLGGLRLHPDRGELVEQGPAVLAVEPPGDRGGHGGADALHLHQVLLGRRREPVEGAEMGGQHQRGVLPDVGDAERVDQPVERHRAAGRDARDQVVRGAVGEALQASSTCSLVSRKKSAASST